MSLEQTYTRFLVAPNADVLDPAVTFHYITTAISVNGPQDIIRQLNQENQRQLKKRVQKPLASIETSNSLVLEVETEIEFLTSGANWLPGLDDNFLADHIVRFPVVHIVNFEKGLIKEARLYWDQANLLKQLGVIGRTGRNWPIKDGNDQIIMINESVSRQSAKAVRSIPQTPERSRSKGPENVTRDPHASLQLFSPADELPEPEKIRAPRSSSAFRPPSRNLESIIGEDDGPLQPVKPPKSRGSYSQRKTLDLGEHMKEDDDADIPKVKPPKTKLVDPSKYSHFEFADEPDNSQSAPAMKPSKSTHRSTWDFEDFTTPEKRPLKMRRDDVRSFDFSEEDETEQKKKPATLSNVTNSLNAVANGRGTNTSHFEIADNSPAGKAPIAKKKLSRHMQRQEESDDDGDDFFASFGAETKSTGIRIAGNGQGQNKSIEREWSYDQAVPSKGSGKFAGIRIAGNGQGQSKSVEREWSYDKA